jgi:hypothetical protein
VRVVIVGASLDALLSRRPDVAVSLMVLVVFDLVVSLRVLNRPVKVSRRRTGVVSSLFFKSSIARSRVLLKVMMMMMMRTYF